MNIEYQYTEGKHDVPIKVRLDGRIVGTIKPVTGGWQYFPLNHKRGGEIFPTAGDCQRSLEFEYEPDEDYILLPDGTKKQFF